MTKEPKLQSPQDRRRPKTLVAASRWEVSSSSAAVESAAEEMGKAKGKQRQDKFYHLAKEQGYRSRAAFKLLQLDARYRFLPTARAVLDLCAAPGGWVQVAVNHAPVGAFVVGVDLVPIRPIRGAHSLTEDITTTKCRAAVRRLMDANGVSAFDVVLHDGSPNVGGAWAQEATSQSALVIDAVRLATMFLAPRGAFITKVTRCPQTTVAPSF
jgi:AdoMet-dependent rRNA methyltransferase SPB1